MMRAIRIHEDDDKSVYAELGKVERITDIVLMKSLEGLYQYDTNSKFMLQKSHILEQVGLASVLCLSYTHLELTQIGDESPHYKQV